MSFTETLDELRASARKINEKISRIEHARRRETNQQHVGKYFKFRNSFSCPEKPSDYWWLYIFVTGLTPDGSLQYTEFQKDKYGEVTFKAKKQMYWLNDAGYRPAKKREFDAAWKAAVRHINAICPR